MADPLQFEVAVRELAKVIDRNEPPGIDALALARSVVSLVKDRGPRVCVVLSVEFDRLRDKLQ